MTGSRMLPLLLVGALALALGWWGRGQVAADAPPARVGGACPGGAEPLYWKAPMDATYIRDAPGKSPMGMDLVPECPGATAVDDAAVVIDATTMQNMGVRTERASVRDVARSVRAVGRVAVDERKVAHVHTKVQGWVERLFIESVGKRVERGERLLEIYSPELMATQEELLLAARYRDATGGSPFDDVRGGGESLFQATRRRLELWDMAPRDIEALLANGRVSRTLTLHAPAPGVVTELGVRAGMEVTPNHNLYTIADLSAVWVLADVYEYELPWLAVGQEAKVEIASLPGTELSGPITYIAPFLDPQTRTAEVRIEVANADGRLKPGMFGNVVIASAPRSGVVAISADAVLHSGKRTLAVVALGGGRFEPREIETGVASDDGWIEVLSGVAADDEIVVSSQFLIDSESKLREAVRKLLVERNGAAHDDDSMGKE